MKEVFTKSENFKQEYSATIVKVGELKDIENSDNLKQAIIDGFSVVVNKNDVKEGDIMVYCKNETEIVCSFLSINNMYEMGHSELNANAEAVQSLMDEGRLEEAKKLVGYFNKHGRVKMIKLRGCPSMGVLFSIEPFVKWDETLKDVNLEDYIKYDENGNFIPFDFDTINDRLFIKAYVPKVTHSQHAPGTGKSRTKINRFDRMLDGEFLLHYDTNQLNSNMWKLNPDSVVSISTKVHGTSAVFGNVLVKRDTFPNKMKMFFNNLKDKKIKRHTKAIKKSVSETEIAVLEKKISKLENCKFKKFDTEYCDIYSSRTVIKNKDINKSSTSGYYKVDVWGEYHELLKGKIPNNVTVYGEIVGYLPGTASMIQKGYDYGCKPGENRFMIYRVSEKKEDGSHKEYEISEVIDFIKALKANYPELTDRLMDYTLLYNGKLSDLYPEVDAGNHWNENILELLKNDKEHFGMEMDEPMCKNKVPREGIVLRIDNDSIKEAFKLKCCKFLLKESKDIDAGNVDIEMMDNYVSNK